MSILGNILHTATDVGNIPKALTMFEGISKRDPSLASKYLDPTQFVNHNLQAPEGVAGVQGFISHLPSATAPLRVVRAFQDGDYVFTHAEETFSDPKYSLTSSDSRARRSSNTGTMSQPQPLQMRVDTPQPTARPKRMIWRKPKRTKPL